MGAVYVVPLKDHIDFATKIVWMNLQVVKLLRTHVALHICMQPHMRELMF